MKIALVHDYLKEYGGAERVLEVLHEMWPEAPLYTSFVDWPSFAKAPEGKVEYFKSWDIRTSWVQKHYLVKKYISPLRFLAPRIWGSFDLSDYDLVISSSGWFMCRGIGMPKPKAKSQKPKFLHISYIHHPPRNLYGYATGSSLQKYWPVRAYASIINFFLRHYDYETAQSVDYFIANSKETARRVEKFYRRESTVIYPPIETNSKFEILNSKQIRNSKFEKSKQDSEIHERKYFLSVGRLSWAKRVDLIIQACNELKLPLKVVGTGKEEKYLKSIAGKTIEFMGSVSDEELAKLYSGAKALVFTALDEDFGMVPVEAMSYGTPVIALAQGGVLETVVDGNPSAGSGQATGVFFDKPEVKDLVKALKKFEANIDKKNYYANCINQAEKFSKVRFKREIKKFVESKLKERI
ncbi:glycosyltransferase [Patescibacteria group bacterium]